jgi:enduracididine biosynthesis enzyme MppP
LTDWTSSRHVPNLTELELNAIESGINVADGHARHELTVAQQKIIAQLPDLFTEAAQTPAATLDTQAKRAFLKAVGQHTAITAAEVLSCYSSSVAMEIFGRALLSAGVTRVAMIHPTFDNIPDILRGMGMTLIPLAEEALLDGSAAIPQGVQVLFITTPNNPTGSVLQREQLIHWAQVCAANGIILALDTSFRGFDVRAQYDHFEVLVQSGCRYVVIEDTGKLWPTLDLKVGFLVFTPGEPLPLHRIHTDILLGVSPLILLLVKCFAEDARDGGFDELHRFVHTNRTLLRDTLAGLPTLSFPDRCSRISVERIALPEGTTASEVWQALRRQNVHLLPCRQFHWADPEVGERFVRMALGRPPEMISAAAAALRGCAGLT